MLSGRGFLLTEKNKHLLTINHKSETKSFDGVTYPFKFGERYDLIQVANKICKKCPICAKFELDIAYIQVCHGFERICKNLLIWAKSKLDIVYIQVCLCW